MYKCILTSVLQTPPPVRSEICSKLKRSSAELSLSSEVISQTVRIAPLQVWREAKDTQTDKGRPRLRQERCGGQYSQVGGSAGGNSFASCLLVIIEVSRVRRRFKFFSLRSETESVVLPFRLWKRNKLTYFFASFRLQSLVSLRSEKSRKYFRLFRFFSLLIFHFISLPIFRFMSLPTFHFHP